jgi:tRNA pseudouridine55 synthase
VVLASPDSKMSSKSNALHGFLIIDKPAGWTSHDVVTRVRRLIGERHVGHAGTLDPAATGVLPIAIGHATKVLEYLSEASKTYLAEVTFGVETDSYDVDGQVIGLRDASRLTESEIEQALTLFRGKIEQIPPMHSAIKIGGKKLYELARKGEVVERAPRSIEIYRLELVEWFSPTATFLIDCSKGTYVRSLAKDLGESVGAGAFLSGLVRLRTGPFLLCEAWTLGDLEEINARAAWPDVAIHPDAAVIDWPALLLDEEATRRWETGRWIEAVGNGEILARVYNADGVWAGIATYDSCDSHWRQSKVVVSA